MTRAADIIRMAREAGIPSDELYHPNLERFAALVAAAERSTFNFCPRCGKRTQDIHTCTPPADNWAYPTNNDAS